MTKKAYLATLAALIVCGSASAQDIYKAEALTGSDLSGTARYVGMGGAMNVLGADLSTMGVNPAATGLFRRSQAALTGGVTAQEGAATMYDVSKARGTFDQGGFVYSAKIGGESVRYLNFGFNYQKRRNFKNYAAASALLSGNLSQTWELRQMAGALDLANDGDREYTMPVAAAGYDAQLIEAATDANNKITGYRDLNGQSYDYRRVQWGGVQEYDFNLSVNGNDRYYAGLTVGFYNVNMHSGVLYAENFGYSAGNGAYSMAQEESLTGAGVDVKLGFIFRPIENNPLRIGLAVSSPTWYDLTSNSDVAFRSTLPFKGEDVTKYHPYSSGDDTYTASHFYAGDYDYRLRTPWKVNVGVATTVDKYLALDAEYEFCRYPGCSFGYPSGDGGYYYDEWHSSTQKDKYLNDEVSARLKPVHTFRVGAELYLAPGLKARVGYNYVSSPFKDNANLNLFTSSPSYYARTNTDYINLSGTHRVTVGLGYSGKHLFFDAAYQYQTQKGTAYAFNYLEDSDQLITNRLAGQGVDFNRHNAVFTLGYKF